MALFEPIHPEFVQAIRVLDAVGMPYAELWRAIIPVGQRLDLPRPSYETVRRLAKSERRRKIVRRQELDYVLSRTLRGLAPFPTS